MVSTVILPAGQKNVFISNRRVSVPSVSPSRMPLSVQATGRKKSEGDAASKGSRRPNPDIQELKTKIDALAAQIPQDVRQKAQEAAAKAGAVVDEYLPAENRKAIEEQVQKTVENFDPENLEAYKQNLEGISKEVVEAIPDESLKTVAETYLKNFVALHVGILNSVKDVGGTALKVASGESSLGDFASTYRKTFIKAHQDSFKAHGEVAGANLRLGQRIAQFVLGRGKSSKPSAEEGQKPEAEKTED